METLLKLVIVQQGFLWSWLLLFRGKEGLWNRLYNAAHLMSCAANWFFLGGDGDESLSSRIGKSIRAEGWASRLPWPGFARTHFLSSIEDDEGRNSDWLRQERV